MLKIFIILVVAAIFESIGVALLAGGLKQLNGIKQVNVSEICRIIVEGATNHKILIGIGLQAIFFFCLIYMMSQRDVSFVWPLTSLGMIITPIAARIFLNEQVSAMRWAGIVMIGLGACLISYSEHEKEQAAKVSAAPVTHQQQQQSN